MEENTQDFDVSIESTLHFFQETFGSLEVGRVDVRKLTLLVSEMTILNAYFSAILDDAKEEPMQDTLLALESLKNSFESILEKSIMVLTEYDVSQGMLEKTTQHMIDRITT